MKSKQSSSGLSSDSHCLPLFIYIGEKLKEDRKSNFCIGEPCVIKQGNITIRQQGSTLHSPPQSDRTPLGLRSDTRTVLGLRSDSARTF